MIYSRGGEEEHADRIVSILKSFSYSHLDTVYASHKIQELNIP